MNNAQFYVLLGTTLGTALGGALWTRAEFHALGARIDRLETRMDALSARVDRLGEQLNARIDRLYDDLRLFDRALARHEKAIEILERRS